MIKSAQFFDQPTLRGHGLRLEPLGLQHEDGLRLAAADGELWQLRVTSVPEPENTRTYIEAAQRMHREHLRVPYAVIDDASARVLGSTSFHDLIPAAGRLEIGYTWYAQSVQKTHVNTACKLLMMSRGFDELGALIVGWRTDILNVASQRAIEKLGAQREGILRSSALRRDASIRDAVVYSMAACEWPLRRLALTQRLNRLLGAAPNTHATSPQPSAAELRFVELAQLSPRQVQRLGRLSPGALGSLMVSPNAMSITDSWGVPTALLWALVWTTSRGDSTHADPVGLMLVDDPSLADASASELTLWRLSIGFDHQGKGLGKAAMAQLLRYAQTRPGIRSVKLSHADQAGHAGPFYERFGFRYTGEIDDDAERYMVLTLR